MPMSKQRGEQKEGKPGIEYFKIGWSLLKKKKKKFTRSIKGFKIQYFYATVRGSNFAKKFRSRWKWFPFKVNIAWKDESKRLIIEWSRKTEIIKLKQ